MVDTCQKHPNLGKTFFAIFVDTGQICTGFEADTPKKLQKHARHM